jgi:hypothetical protein
VGELQELEGVGMRKSAIQRNHEMRMMILKGLVWAIGLAAVVGLVQKFW